MWNVILHLVQICTRIRGDPLKYLHIVNEYLTRSSYFSFIRTICPASADGRVSQAIPPDRVKTCGLRVYTGYLSTGDEAIYRGCILTATDNGNKLTSNQMPSS